MEIKLIEQGKIDSCNVIQEHFNIELPSDYCTFLTKHNGAVIDDNYFYVDDLKEYILFNLFYGVNTSEKSYDLISKNTEYIEDIPEESILIGRDQGGGWILLICDGENDGIWYYDHSYFFEQSSDELNTYFICETFSEFLKILETTKPQ